MQEIFIFQKINFLNYTFHIWIFSYPQISLNKSIVFKPIHRKMLQIDKSFSNRQKIKKRQIFFKSTKKVQIGKSFSNP